MSVGIFGALPKLKAYSASFDWESLDTLIWRECMDWGVLALQFSAYEPELFDVDMTRPFTLEETIYADPMDFSSVGFINIDGSWYEIRKKENSD